MKKIIGIICVLVVTFSVPAIAKADPITAPVTVTDVRAFEEIYDEGTNVNYIFAVRFDLPEETWYPYLKDQTGCESQIPSSTIRCTYPDTLSSTLVTIGLYDDLGVSYGTNFNEPLTIIGNTLTGLNSDDLPDGKDLETLAADDSQVCIKSYDTYGSTGGNVQNTSCGDIKLSIGTGSDTYKDRMTSYLEDTILEIQTVNNLPEETLITNTAKVTGQGVFITRRVSPLLQQQIPELFAVGLVEIFGERTPFATPVLQGELLSIADTGDYTSSSFKAGEVMAQQYFGMTGSRFFAFGFLGLGLLAGVGMYLLSGNSFMGATIGFSSVLVASIFLVPTIAIQIAAGMFVLVIGLIVFIVRKMPN